MLLLGEIGPVEAEKFNFEDSLFFRKMAFSQNFGGL